ncbi:MAG: hypothetical protein JXR69_09985 [Candidatus Delongbacteria bacterium]|nr:hypothetical protein [Candidatus Delongbacteria bacterium]
MIKNIITIFLLVILSSKVFPQLQKDTLYVDYSDYSTHKLFSLNLNYAHNDTLSLFSLSGNNKLNSYTDYSKNQNDINVQFLGKNKYFNIGGELNSNFKTNTSGLKPTYSEISLMPKIQFSLLRSNINLAAGYIGKNDELTFSKGFKWDIDIYSKIDLRKNSFTFSGSNNGDNLDKEINYNSNVLTQYFEILDDNLGNYSLGGEYIGSQYHYYDSQYSSNRVIKKEYSLSGSFNYNIISGLDNLISTRYFQRDKNIYVDESQYSYNENLNIKFIDELSFYKNTYRSIFRVEFDTGSNKFTHNNSDESFSFYTFQLKSNHSYIFFKDLESSLAINYFKHQYKSLTLSNSEDRDILKFTVDPVVSYRFDNILHITQSFPLEFYHLINISAEKSSSNYIDRVINSVTGYSLYKDKPINLSGKFAFQSYFRSYDYDETFTRSFIIKNYGYEDTINFVLANRSKAQLSTNYKYEEFGNFNYDEFKENPITYKIHYYIAFGYTHYFSNKFNLKSEYYFYEIDDHDFDQTDFNKNILKNVFIIHGPIFSSSFVYNKFSITSNLKIDFYQDNETKYNFILRSGYSF